MRKAVSGCATCTYSDDKWFEKLTVDKGLAYHKEGQFNLVIFRAQERNFREAHMDDLFYDVDRCERKKGRNGGIVKGKLTEL